MPNSRGLPSDSLPPVVNSRTSSIDKTVRYIGQLDPQGSITKLEKDPSCSPLVRTKPPRAMKQALDSVAHSKRDSSTETSSQASESSSEDYDALRHDPGAVLVGGKGGGYGKDNSGNGSPDLRLDTSFGEIKIPARPGPLGLKSIPVTLDKLKGTGEKGRYILTADDDALREILKSGIEREKNSGSRKRRSKFSDLVFTRRFTAFDRQNAESADSPFHGFFTLFWLGTAIFMAQLAAKNWRQHGNILGTNEIWGLMFHRDVLVLGLSDGVLCASTGFGLLLQWAIQRGWLSWNKQGWIIQTVWGALYLACVLGWTLFREWPWTHTVFFVLHGLVMLMKQHSYAFYNGYLSEAYKMRSLLEAKLKQLDKIEPMSAPSATEPKPSALSTSYLDRRPSGVGLNQRRASLGGGEEAANIQQVADAIESGEPLDVDQIQTFERIIKWEIDALSEDLKGKTSAGGKHFPDNLTIANHYEYIVLPTLVYELEYPRSDKVHWDYVAEKTIAVFGVLGIMNLVSQSFIYPVVVRTIEMKDAGMPLLERLKDFPWILSDLIFPFMMEYMMSWYLIWECILNLLAELTYFADRGFYADWWNSVSWDQFARDWNRPVHNFLLRHVYHSSISTMKVNKSTATLLTFLLSALVHELVMWCIFKKLRGYLLVLQMMQPPLVALSRSRLLKNRPTLGNLIFWIGIFTGPSLLCSLYLII